VLISVGNWRQFQVLAGIIRILMKD